MQNVKAFHLLYLLFIAFPFSLSAQETLVPDGIFFQNEIIRKVSVGEGGVWVIKGADSTGVGKLEPDGRELDYTQTVNTSFPLTGIVGKYGDSAMIATKGNSLLKYNKGTISRMDQENGILGNKINDIAGTPNYTRVATSWGARESFDNNQFSALFSSSYASSGPEILKVSKAEDFPASVAFTQSGYCSPAGEVVYDFVIKNPATLYQTNFPLGESGNLNAFATNKTGKSYNFTLFLGDNSGLRARYWECRSQETLLLQDTTVYAISKIGAFMFAGTENGLFYCANQYPKKASKVHLDNDYEVYDIAVQEDEGFVWLATNKGLLKIRIDGLIAPKEVEIESLEWAKSIGGQFADEPFSTITDKEGNLFVTGYFQGAVNFGDSTVFAQNKKDFFLAKYDTNGKLAWVRSASNSSPQGKSMDEEGEYLAVDSKGNIYVALKIYNGYSENENWKISFAPGVTIENTLGTGKYIVKYDKTGTARRISHLENSYPYDELQMETDSKDNLYLSLQLRAVNPYNLAEGRGIIKFNPELKVSWAKQFPDAFTHFKLKESGEFYLSGSSANTIALDDIEITPDRTNELIVVLFNETGKPKWWKNFGGYAYNDHIRDIRAIDYDLQGNTFIAGDFVESLDFGDGKVEPENDGLFIAKINAIGEFDWVHTAAAGNATIKGLVADSLGSTYVSLRYTGYLNIGNQNLKTDELEYKSFLAKLDPLGNYSWGHSLPGVSITNEGIARDHSNNIFFHGTLAENIRLNGNLLKGTGGANIFLAKINDPTGYLNRNLVRGRVFFDKNKNNKFDEGDEPIRDNIIKALPGPVYAKSDQNGNYFLFLDKGNYSIEQIIPTYKGKIITPTYPDQPYQLELPDTKADTAGFDFAHDVELSPHLSVDLSSTRFRRCFTNTTVVEYCNEGFAAAENVQLELEYPEYVIPLSSDLPWSSKDGTKLIFDIGTVQAQQCKTITLTDSVICGNEDIRGLTQCIKARITPVHITTPNPEWDQSDIILSAECKDNGFVRLNLDNNGNGNMADSAVFKIFLQETLSYTGKYKLKKGENMSLNVLANGKPLHLEAELSPFHPHKKSVSINIDGCDEDGNPQLSHTFTNQFPQHDDQENYEISCLEIIDSFDPNDKQVIPAGISAQHYVEEGSLLEYTIRFQNTGTDTAYTVVITDLLDDNLDISSLKVGLSSHPVKWDLSGEEQATIAWRFSNINLPDSTTNEKASHGFVKFKMMPKQEAGFGTAVKNKAAIYFDYNSPIITNETLTTLGIPESTSEDKIAVQNCNVSVSLQQEEDVEIVLCENNSLQLSRMAPEPGRGKWSIIKGEANIVDPYSHQSAVEDIAYGENIFQWEVSYCDVRVRSKVTVIREALPAAPEVNPVPDLCQNSPLSTLYAEGNEIGWYADPALTQLLGTGNSYQLKNLDSDRIYVTQQNINCESQASVVALTIHPAPAPPVTKTTVEACVELKTDFLLSAEGNELRWYADEELKDLLGEGESYQPKERVSQTYFVTQSNNYCESDPAKIVLKTKAFDPSKAFFANVITPNGDEWNQRFFVQAFESEECLGNFVAVKIYNRLGKIIFESSERGFEWDATNAKPGIYFYSLEYKLKKFNSNIQVMR